MSEIEKVLSIAEAEEGYLEKMTNAGLESKVGNAGNNNYTKYGKEMGCNGQPWCDAYVDWCFKKAFGDTRAKELLGGYSNYTPTSAQYFKNKNCWHVSNPKRGDIIFFKNDARINHTGIVLKVDGSTVYTIEGNTSKGKEIIPNGGGVYKKSYSLSNSRIAGYGRPPYTDTQKQGGSMKTSQKGIDLIKKHEGCKLVAYKALPTEQYYTIGYGHYGADVKSGMRITQAQAEAYLRVDLNKFEKAVNGKGLPLNQNQFDALVSFVYNCGEGNLNTLIKGRTLQQIGEAILKYDKAGGKVLAGLTKRRREEYNLFLFGTTSSAVQSAGYKEPSTALRVGNAGEGVKWLQDMLNKKGAALEVDGSFGQKTLTALKEFQKKAGLEVDGVCGTKTRAALKG